MVFLNIILLFLRSRKNQSNNIINHGKYRKFKEDRF